MDTRPYYLVGSSGYPNYGDEFIAAAWLRYLAEVDPHTEVWLDSPEPANAQHLFDGLHPRLRVTNTLWRAVRMHAHLPPAEAAARVADLVRNLGSPAFDLGLLKLREARSLHLIGGGYVNDVWPHHAGLVTGMLAVKELTQARLFATGQGLLPVISGFDRPQGLFEGFDHASARDGGSADAYSVSAGLDDAFLGAAAGVWRSAPPAPGGLMVCIQSDLADPARLEAILASVRPVIAEAVANGTPVHYLEAIPGPDRAAYEQLADLIPAENFLPFAHIWQHGLPVGPDQQWLTTRFHLHLLASAAGARGVALSVREGYYDVKHASLAELGSGWHVDAGSGAISMPAGPGGLAGRLAELTAQKRAEAAALYPAPAPAPAAGGAETRQGPAQGTRRLLGFAARARR